MRKILLLAAIAAATALPTSANAQARGGVILIDTANILSNCTACKAAQTQLEQRQTTLRSRVQTLTQQLQTEGKPIQDAVDALKGKQPDAALQQRITAFQTKERGAQQEIQNSQRQLQSTAAHVQQQVGARLIQIVEQVRARRGASIAVSKDSTLANDSSIDVTTEVLAALNQALPSVSVTPLPQQQQQQQQQQPQGR
jgi:Skp family chaperone for outer membrane proteins